MSQPSSERMNETASRFLDDQLDFVKEKITAEAWRLAESDGRDTIRSKDVAEVYKRFAPGNEIHTEKEGVLVRLGSVISPITIISAILAIFFGALGAWRGSQSALDLAKIFAGAIVGSTGAAVPSAIKRR
jgi:hypothetical protein